MMFAAESDEVPFIEGWEEYALALGNISTTYKFCYNLTEESIIDSVNFVRHYGTLGNYLLNFIPNLLSYAF